MAVVHTYITAACVKLLFYHRNPDPNSRPQFGQIAEALADDSEHLLDWSDEDKQIGSEDAMRLGAPLGNGNNLYYDLQLQYKQ